MDTKLHHMRLSTLRAVAAWTLWTVTLAVPLLSPAGSAHADNRRVPPPPLADVVPSSGRFSKPTTLADLQAIETRVVDIVDEVVNCTVAIQVSGVYGSGVIISRDGYVLTAAHVIDKPGKRATVRLADGSRVRARTLGVNHAVDAGLLKLEPRRPREWPFLKIGTSTDLEPGDWCLALGHPGGFDVKRSPVVRLGRVLTVRGKTVQTDCTLNSGDSGGPLVDLDGRVIGIHSRIAAPTSWNFHATVTTFHDDWKRFTAGDDWGRGLFASNDHEGPFLGIRGETDEKGCRVTHVESGSPAETGGLRVDDVIVQLEGAAIKGFTELRTQLGRFRAGKSIEVVVIREGSEMTLSVKLGSHDS